MGDDGPCNMKGIYIILIKIFNRMERELKKMRYAPQLKKNHISVGALEALDLEISSRDGVLKILRGLMVVMKGV